MSIRTATIRDKISVLHLLNELGEVENEIRGYSPNHTKAHILGNEIYEEIVKSENAKIFLAEENNEIIGLATLFLVPYIRYGKKRGYVIDFIISKKARSKGFGKVLLQEIKEYCRANNIQRIKVDTGLPEAKKFYKKNGGNVNTETFTFIID